MTRTTSSHLLFLNLLPWLFLLILLLLFAGYVGPWIPHRVSGLVITGLDFGEYVKFLPLVREGQLTIWREGFYLPLVMMSIAASFTAFQPHLQPHAWFRWPLCILLLTAATVAALNLLPPAWDQSTFTNPEFRLQMIALASCLAVMGTSPLWALLPRSITAAIVFLLGVGALWYPIRDFYQVLPSIRELYQQPLLAGWGFYLTIMSIVLLLILHGVEVTLTRLLIERRD